MDCIELGHYFKQRVKKYKLNFKVDEVDKAVEQIVYLRLVKNWTGVLKLETNGKKIIITQYPSSSSYIDGYETIYSIDSHEDWDEFIDTDKEFMELSRKQRWDTLDSIQDFLYVQIDQAQDAMDKVLDNESLKKGK